MLILNCSFFMIIKQLFSNPLSLTDSSLALGSVVFYLVTTFTGLKFVSRQLRAYQDKRETKPIIVRKSCIVNVVNYEIKN